MSMFKKGFKIFASYDAEAFIYRAKNLWSFTSLYYCVMNNAKVHAANTRNKHHMERVFRFHFARSLAPLLLPTIWHDLNENVLMWDKARDPIIVSRWTTYYKRQNRDHSYSSFAKKTKRRIWMIHEKVNLVSLIFFG